MISIDSLATILMLPALALPKVLLTIVPPSRIDKRLAFKLIFPEEDSKTPAVPICMAEALMPILSAFIFIFPPVPSLKTGLKMIAPSSRLRD